METAPIGELSHPMRNTIISDYPYWVNASPARAGFTGLVRTREASWAVAGRGFMGAPCGRRGLAGGGRHGTAAERPMMVKPSDWKG